MFRRPAASCCLARAQALPGNFFFALDGLVAHKDSKKQAEREREREMQAPLASVGSSEHIRVTCLAYVFTFTEC